MSPRQELNTTGGSAALGSRGPTLRKETEERDRLAALIKLQGRELDAIKAEINLLRFGPPFLVPELFCLPSSGLDGAGVVLPCTLGI